MRFKMFTDLLKARKAYRRLFNTEDGKLVLADLAERNMLMRPTTDGSLSDQQAYINEGRRQVVLDIMGIMNFDPDTLPKEYNNG